MVDEPTPGERPERGMPQEYGRLPQQYTQPPARSPGNGWLIAALVAVILCLGGVTAAIIAKDDSGGATNTLPPEALGTVNQSTTTVEHKVTVTVPGSTGEQPSATTQVPSSGTTGGAAPTTTTP